MRAHKPFFIECKGGIDLSTPQLKVNPGSALTMVNFEPELDGGYRRIDGYERTDGQASPAAALYYTVGVADGSGISVGDTLTGATATSKVVIKDGNTLGVTALVSGYVLSEAANGTTISAIEVRSGQTDVDTDNIWQLAAEDYYRDLIAAVPGSGNGIGAVQYGATKYAFRSNGTNAIMYKSSASGWTLVPFFQYLFFDAGVAGADLILIEGATITGASATGTIKRIIKNAGSWSGGTASGYMVVDVTSGAFVDNDPIQVSAVTKATADGASADITLAPGGLMEFSQHNYYGGTTTDYLYGADGVNFAWEFDGTILTPIFFPAPTTNPSWNTPKYLSDHQTHLFLTFPGGQMGHSSLGEPLVFSALLGAATFGLGAECTGIESRAGQVLSIYTADGRTYGLYGTEATSWTMQVLSEAFGAKDRTVQSLGTVYAIDDKGIVPMERVQSFGDFEGATVSRKVKPILDQYKNNIVQTVVVKERNQYRVHFDDGSALIMGDDRNTGGAYQAFTTLKYPNIPVCITNNNDDTGSEVILFMDNAGMVFQAEVGYNFDGAAIEYAYRTPFNHAGSPNISKSYFKCFTDVKANRQFDLKVIFDVGFGGPYHSNNVSETAHIKGGGGYYDVDSFNTIYYDAELFSSAGNELSGNGENISLLYYGKSKYTRSFTIQSINIQYLARNSKRPINA